MPAAGKAYPEDKRNKPRLAVWKFASCDGCQLSLLDVEEHLLAVAEVIEIASFPEASREVQPGPYDVSLVEGSITTPHDAERIQEIRKISGLVVSIGSCATAGGIQALKNYADVGEYTRYVYAHPEYIESLDRSTPISAHVKVDAELRGCPINKMQLVQLLVDLLAGKPIEPPRYSVCVECKQRGIPCVMVGKGIPCLGPVTQAGCGALCPDFHRGCYGCFGPQDTPNTASLASVMKDHGASKFAVKSAFSTFNAAAEAFEKEHLAHE